MARTSKAVSSINKQTNNPNNNALNAIIIKSEGEDGTKAILEDPFKDYDNLVRPPYHLLTLSMLRENSSELGQCIDAMITNIDGFGYRLVPKNESPKVETEAERIKIANFLDNINFDDDITQLREDTRCDLEDTGNAYWEFIPYRNKEGVSSIRRLESHSIRLGKLDKTHTSVELKFYNEGTGKIETRSFKKRFRTYAQIAGMDKVWFKEWGDPRNISSKTGKVIPKKHLIEAQKKKEIANSVFHFRIRSNRTPYGLPRYIGNLFSIYGSRSAEEINFVTFENNNIPSMIVMVSNGQLTEGSINRVKEFIKGHVEGNKNRSSFLILEAESADEEAINPGTMKMDIKDLSNSQKEDQLFQNYDANNSDKIRRCFRLPPIFVGRSDTYNRSTAQESRKLADEQIFSPERRKFDKVMNKILIHEFGMAHHTFQSNSANVTNDEDLVKILSGAEKTGGVTPNIARNVLSDVLNKELPQYEKTDGFDPDIPMSMTIVREAKTVAGNSNTGKIAPNQGQIPKGEEDEEDSKEESTEKDLEILGNLQATLSENIYNEIIKGL